ncbi:MAG: SDR family NAD(P)-dependent oxidoreductase [Nanoarchaeota archaeon]
MEIKNKKVLITGAGGFIGSHLVEELIKLNADIFCFLSSNDEVANLREIEGCLDQVKIIYGDLKNYNEIKNAVEGKDIIFHLGALVSVSDSYEKPFDFFETNSLGTFNLLNASKMKKLKKIIITSSAEVYGNANGLVDEEFPLHANSPYAASKVSAEKFAESFYFSYCLPVSIVRLFNVFGPRQSLKPIIPSIISKSLKDEKINIVNLYAKRDFIFVKDVIDAFLKIAESENSNGEVFNIGNAKVVSIKEILDIVERLMNKKIKNLEIKNTNENSEKLLICNNAKARKILKWEPKTSLEEGLKECIDYYKTKH